jgi:hypothetical protein
VLAVSVGVWKVTVAGASGQLAPLMTNPYLFMGELFRRNSHLVRFGEVSFQEMPAHLARCKSANTPIRTEQVMFRSHHIPDGSLISRSPLRATKPNLVAAPMKGAAGARRVSKTGHVAEEKAR